MFSLPFISSTIMMISFIVMILASIHSKKTMIDRKKFSIWMWVWPKIFFTITFFLTIFFNYYYFFNFWCSNFFNFTYNYYLKIFKFNNMNFNINYFYILFINWTLPWMKSSYT